MDSPKLVAYVVSDIHLNNHPYDRSQEDENPQRKHFRRFLTDLRNRLEKSSDRVLLVFNGDTFDITGSWSDMTLPWDKNTELVEKSVLKILSEIVEKNDQIITELQALLALPNVEMIYIIGNHDRLLGLFPTVQAYIQSVLMPQNSDVARIQFQNTFTSLDLGLYVEHGQRFDPFNYERYQQEPPLGDLINILIVNRFIELTIQKLHANGFSQELISEVYQELKNIEYLRPLSLGPYWLASLARQYRNHEENQNKPRSIEQIIQAVVRETLIDDQMLTRVSRYFFLPKWFLKLSLTNMARFPQLLPTLSFLVTKILHQTSSNDVQHKMATQIHRESGFHLITFGHTHIPCLTPISEEAYYFNTGCWKPILYLFKETNKGILDYFHSRIPFNQIERSAVFKVEKDLKQADAPVVFSLETLQNGQS